MKLNPESGLTWLILLSAADLVASQGPYTCPGDEGKEVIGGNKVYQLRCEKALGANTVVAKPPCSSIQQCADLCAAEPRCLHGQYNFKNAECQLKADLRRPDPQPYMNGHVLWYLRDIPTTPVDNENGAERPLTDDGGAPPAGGGPDSTGNKASYVCGADNGSTFTADNGKVFKLRCGMGSFIGNVGSDTATSLKDCVTKCANNPACVQADYSGTTCNFKGDSAEPRPWDDGHMWEPVFCPETRATSANRKPAITTDLSCPANDGKIYEGADGTWFYLQCCTDTDGSSVLSYEAATSHADCLDRCVKNKKCRGAFFTGTGGTQPENCKLYGQGGFSTTHAEGAHFAYVTEPPTDPVKLSESKLCSTECPYADGQLFQSATGENYQMFCKKRHGTNYLKIERRPTFEACLTSCAASPDCRSVDYEPRTLKCFFSNNNDLPTIDAPAFMSAHSLGCAGACASCKAGCANATAMPLPADRAGCPDDHTKVITAGGEDFRLTCRHCFTSNSAWGEPARTVGDCALACAKNSRCAGVNFINNHCWMHPATETNGNQVGFVRSANCDSLAPFSRGEADREPVIPPNEETERRW